jgi:hypothetical protein
MTESTILTIPPGVPFLPTLADALMDGRLIPGFPDPADPLALAEAIVYLPTRRAARALAALLAERAGDGAVLLPRIVPLGEADAAEMDLAANAFEAEAADLLPPIAPLERRLILTRLIQLWARHFDRTLVRQEPDTPCLVPGAPADAVKLAADLEGLMDALTTEDVPWSNLAGAVEGEYSRYFGITLDFARIAAEYWPRELGQRDASDPTARRTRVIELQAERLRVERPRTPIVIAGSTGSIPATAALIRAVAALPRGAVVLPGLDQDLDAAGWAAIGASTDADCVHGHPQAVLRRLVDEHLGLSRDAVRPLGTPDDTLAARARLLSQALRPAETTEAWAAMPAPERETLAARGCESLSLIEAADEREEALAIAVAMRETLTVPGRTAALVTPDRSLAARVAASSAAGASRSMIPPACRSATRRLAAWPALPPRRRRETSNLGGFWRCWRTRPCGWAWSGAPWSTPPPSSRSASCVALARDRASSVSTVPFRSGAARREVPCPAAASTRTTGPPPPTCSSGWNTPSGASPPPSTMATTSTSVRSPPSTAAPSTISPAVPTRSPSGFPTARAKPSRPCSTTWRPATRGPSRAASPTTRPFSRRWPASAPSPRRPGPCTGV